MSRLPLYLRSDSKTSGHGDGEHTRLSSGPRAHLLPRLSRYSRAAEQLSNFSGTPDSCLGSAASSRRHQQRLQLLCVQLGDQRSFQGRALQLLNEDLGIGQGLPTAPGSVVREGAPSQARGPYVESRARVCVRP